LLGKTLVYIADDWGGGLRIVNVSDPINPVEVGSCQTPDYALDVAVSGNYAYIADDWGGLRIIDVSDPTAPWEVGFYDTPGDAWHVVIDGHCAVVADYDSGFYIIDVSYPDEPRLLGYYDTPGQCRSVAIDGELVYVADGDYFSIYDISEALSTPPRSRTSAPLEFALHPPYPDPFNPITTISFELPHTDQVTLKVYNLLGQEVATLVNSRIQAGSHSVPFNASGLASGIYFYRLRTSTQSKTKKMVLLK